MGTYCLPLIYSNMDCASSSHCWIQVKFFLACFITKSSSLHLITKRWKTPENVRDRSLWKLRQKEKCETRKSGKMEGKAVLPGTLQPNQPRCWYQCLQMALMDQYTIEKTGSGVVSRVYELYWSKNVTQRPWSSQSRLLWCTLHRLQIFYIENLTWSTLQLLW